GGGQQGGGATAEEHARRGSQRTPFPQLRAGEPHFRDRAFGMLRLGGPGAEFGGGVGVEIAVAATHRAERDVDVDTERCLGHFFASLTELVSEVRAAMRSSWGTSAVPMFFIRFLLPFCFPGSLPFREIPPP